MLNFGCTITQKIIPAKIITPAETAIDSGQGIFSITFIVGTSSKQRRESWDIFANRGTQPILDLYLQTEGESLLLPQVPEATKIARFYPDQAQLYSRFQGDFNLSDVMGVLATINKVTHTVLASSRNNLSV